MPSTVLQKWVTAGVAAAGFTVFLAAVLGFRSVSRPDSGDLGVSVWLERPATESRLKPVVDDLLKQPALAAAMVSAVDPSWLKSAENPPKIAAFLGS